MAGTATATAGGLRYFEYRARNAEGKLVKGNLEASSEGGVVDKLRTMSLSPVEIKETVGGGSGLSREISFGSFGKGVDLKALSIFSRQMATMISAGLSLLKTLAILAEQTENKKLKGILATVTRDVESGSSLSQALGRHPVDFPPIMVNMIRAGETGGFLEGALASVAGNFEKESKLKNTIKSAMMYPVMVLAMSVVAVIIMLIFIVPIFKKMFEGSGGLPAPTQILVTISENMYWITPVLLVVVIGFSAWWRVNKNTDAVRQKIDPFKLKMPVFGLLMKKIAIARFTRNLANMIGAGVPILQALVIVGETSGNYVVEKAAKSVAESVKQGKSISGPMAEESVFPPMVVQMVAVGEDSGALETMLEKIADFYDDEVETMTKGLTSLIEPLLIAFLGVVVGGMIVALYMPIFNIVSVAGS